MLCYDSKGPCDRRTDGRTELRWLRRAIAVPAVACKNASLHCLCVTLVQIALRYLVSIRRPHIALIFDNCYAIVLRRD